MLSHACARPAACTHRTRAPPCCASAPLHVDTESANRRAVAPRCLALPVRSAARSGASPRRATWRRCWPAWTTTLPAAAPRVGDAQRSIPPPAAPATGWPPLCCCLSALPDNPSLGLPPGPPLPCVTACACVPSPPPRHHGAPAPEHRAGADPRRDAGDRAAGAEAAGPRRGGSGPYRQPHRGGGASAGAQG